MKTKHIHTPRTYIAIVAALLGFAPLSWAGPVIQEPVQEPVFYVFGYGGANWLEGTDGTTNGLTIDLDTETGWNGGGGFGWRSWFLGGSRFEVEGFYRNNDVDNANFNGFADAFHGTDDLRFQTSLEDNGVSFESAGVMVNLLKEFPLFEGGVVLYGGGGIGWSSVTADGHFAGDDYEANADVFTWQVIAGLEFPITPRFGLYTEYRLTPFTDFSLGTDTAIGDLNLGFDETYNHGVVGGFRVYF